MLGHYTTQVNKSEFHIIMSIIINSLFSFHTQCSDVIKIIDSYAQTKPLAKQVFFVTDTFNPRQCVCKFKTLESGVVVVHNNTQNKEFYPTFCGNVQIQNMSFFYKFSITAHNRYFIFCSDDLLNFKTIVIIDTILWKIAKTFEFKQITKMNGLLFHMNKLYIGMETGIWIFDIEFVPQINIIGEIFIQKKIGRLMCVSDNKLIFKLGDMILKFFDLNFRHSQTIHIPFPQGRGSNEIGDVVVNGDNEILVLHGDRRWDDRRWDDRRWDDSHDYTIVANTVSTITTTCKYVVSTPVDVSRRATGGEKSTQGPASTGHDHHHKHHKRRLKKMEKYGKLIRPEEPLCTDLSSKIQPEPSFSFMSTTIGTRSDFYHIILKSRGSSEIVETIVPGAEIGDQRFSGEHRGYWRL